MSLKDQGFRFIVRKDEHGRVVRSEWMPPDQIEPGDTDCTDMPDAEFDQVMLWYSS